MDNKPLSLNARVLAKRLKSSKTPFPNSSTSFYALGTSTTNSSTSQNASQSVSVSSSGTSSTSLNKMQSVKRDTPPSPMNKKLKLFQNKPLSTSQTTTPSSTSIFTESSWEEKAIEKDPSDLLKCINDALNANKQQTVQSYLFGVVKQLRRQKDPILYQVLGQLVKNKPTIFHNDQVTEAFCTFLKKDPSGKLKTNISATLLTINLMLAAYRDELNWPTIFIKLYVDDSLGDRIWVDNNNSKQFIDNLILTFNTKQPPKYLLNQDDILASSNPTLTSKQDSASSSPSQLFNEDSQEQANSPFNLFLNEIKDYLEDQQTINNRYLNKQEQIIEYVTKTINEQLNRRQIVPEMNKNLVKLLVHTIGIQTIRQQIVGRMEIWLQNPKLSRSVQDLLLSLCINCNEHDNEVIATLIKMRLKTKPLINQFVSGIRELVNQNENALCVVLRATIQNELSSNRNRNNMQLIAALFQTKFEQSNSTLANLIKEMIIKDDCLKSIRALVREIMRSLRHENLSLTSFVIALCDGCNKYDEIDPHDFVVKERLFSSIADLISLCIFLCISPVTKELGSLNKNERKEVLKQLQFQIADIQRIAIKWLQTSVRKFFNPDRNEYIRCLNKVLLIESQDQYWKLDNYPPEQDRVLIFRLTQEVPVLEETILRLLNMGLSKEYFLQPTEVIEIVDTLIRRAASLYDGDQPYSLKINDENILKMLLKSTTYKAPENIKLPDDYKPPSMAINDWYWKVWLQILLLTSHNPSKLGAFAARNYPTLSILIEMVITNYFDYPPPSRQTEDLEINEQQRQLQEKQEILQFESHLAAGSTKILINETNSLLLTKLITFDPTGIARRPPSTVVEELKQLNNLVRLGSLLCQSRNPDFLLEIMQRQQKQDSLQSTTQLTSSMVWLTELVEMNSDNFTILPTQCLCEFILSQSNEDDLNTLNANCLTNNNFLNTIVQEKNRFKEKRKKFFKLIIHFQNVLKTSNKEAEVIELIEYLMRRLCHPQSSYRQVVIRALSLILASNPSIDDEQVLINNIEQKVDSRVWLIEKLPQIESFERIKAIACYSLKEAILIESNPENVWNYTNFLSLYTVKPDQSLIFNLSRLLIERPVMTKFLIQCEYYSDQFLASCLRLFYKFLNDIIEQENKEIDLSNKDDKDYVIIKWQERDKVSLLNFKIVHAMILLLTYGPTEEEKWLYQDFLDIWFSPPPTFYKADLQTQIPNFIPDWIKLRLIRSTVPTLVDFAMQDLKLEQLLLFIQTFGIPLSSMERLFSALDKICKEDPQSVQKSIKNLSLMKQLVEVEKMRGIKQGDFLLKLLSKC